MSKMSSFLCKTGICFTCLQIPFNPFLSATETPKAVPQEIFFLRRMTEFYKDNQHDLIKTQIIEFLNTHPASNISDNLYAILGDLYFEEKAYPKAIESYQNIKNKEIKNKVSYRFIRSFYELKESKKIIDVALEMLASEHESVESEEILYLLGDAFFKEMTSSVSPSLKAQNAADAKDCFEHLSSKAYQDESLSQLAQVYHILEDYEAECRAYSKLSLLYPDRAQDYLYQKAQVQLQYIPDAAPAAFEEAAQMKGPLSSTAAYQQLILLFEQKKYIELVQNKDRILDNLDPKHKPLFDFCIGESFFQCGQFESAISYLSAYADEDKGASTQKQSALLTLISCSFKTEKVELFEKYSATFLKMFGNHDKAPYVLLLRSQKSLKANDKSGALADLKKILDQFPKFEDRSIVLYDYGVLLSELKDWKSSRLIFLSYLKEYPSSSQASSVWSLILNCSIENLKASNQGAAQKQLIYDLTRCLKEKGALSSNDRPSYHLLLGQLLYEVGDFKKCLLCLEQFIQENPHSSLLGQAHLTAAFACAKLQIHSQVFIDHATDAVTLLPDAPQSPQLHLELFNRYLISNQLNKAAEHLYSAYVSQKEEIKDENLNWLATYYYEKALTHEDDIGARAKARSIFEKLLKIDANEMSIKAPYPCPYIDQAAFKYVALLNPEEKLRFLQSLHIYQKEGGPEHYKTYLPVYFELAKAYEEKGDTSKAIQTFNEIARSTDSENTYFAKASILEESRLIFEKSLSKGVSKEDPEIVRLLNNLKDLQIQKGGSSQTLSIQAALLYADIQTACAKPHEQNEKKEFFLKRIKEDFDASYNFIDKTYQETEQALGNKSRDFKNYIKCIEGELFMLRSLSAKKAKQKANAREARSNAIEIFEEILTEKNLPPSLRQRVEFNLKVIQ